MQCSTHVSESRRAYYATISYVDSLIGEALQILDEMDAANDTVVIVTGDHGWHLGEFNMYVSLH
jgi:iduronate 2-sulfatase